MKKFLPFIILCSVLILEIYSTVESHPFKKLSNHSSSEQNLPTIKAKKSYRLVEYQPLTKSQCLEYKDSLGLKYCPYDNDHLAGAALACHHIDNLPSSKDLHLLAKQIYNNQTNKTSIYGNRNDKMLKDMEIFVNDSHIYYWAKEESSDGEGGYVRMFASKGSIPYYVPRDGSGYVTNALGKVSFGNTKHIKTSDPKRDSNLVGLPNNDVLVAICNK